MQLTDGLFFLIPVLFVVVGVWTWAIILWGLLTGGPRAQTQPGAPFLYDRVYYLLWLIAITGWSGGLIAFAAITEDSQPTGFLVGWSLCAIGMGLLFVTRGDMMLKGARYLSQHGFWLTRLHYKMLVMQFERQNSTFRKLIGGIFALVGTGMLIFNLPHLPKALSQVEMGAVNLLHIAIHILRAGRLT